MRVLQACWLLAQRTGGVRGCKTIDAGPPLLAHGLLVWSWLLWLTPKAPRDR